MLLARHSVETLPPHNLTYTPSTAQFYLGMLITHYIQVTKNTHFPLVPSGTFSLILEIIYVSAIVLAFENVGTSTPHLRSLSSTSEEATGERSRARYRTPSHCWHPSLRKSMPTAPETSRKRGRATPSHSASTRVPRLPIPPLQEAAAAAAGAPEPLHTGLPHQGEQNEGVQNKFLHFAHPSLSFSLQKGPSQWYNAIGHSKNICTPF